MPSQALTSLTDRLTDVDQLMAAHAAVGGTQRGRRFEVEGLNRAAVLMLSAHFEGYLEDVMAEALAALNSGQGRGRGGSVRCRASRTVAATPSPGPACA